MQTDTMIVLFDGVCNFCNFWVNVLLNADKKDILRFASLQSHFGQEFLKINKLPTDAFDTFIVIYNGAYYTKSTAALMIAGKLGGVYSLLTVFYIIPAFLRDIIYNIIAKNRYRFFGKREECRIPTKEEKAKFISD